MLPFLKKKSETASPGLIVKTREPDEKPEETDSSGIETCAQELIRAIHSRDSKAVAEALKDVFTVLESEPHEESGVSPHTYDAQNIKAGEQE